MSAMIACHCANKQDRDGHRKTGQSGRLPEIGSRQSGLPGKPHRGLHLDLIVDPFQGIVRQKQLLDRSGRWVPRVLMTDSQRRIERPLVRAAAACAGMGNMQRA